MNPSKMQGAGKVLVWWGMWGNKIVWPVVFDTNLNVEMYLNMPQDTIMSSLLNENGEFPAYFQRDGFLLNLKWEWFLVDCNVWYAARSNPSGDMYVSDKLHITYSRSAGPGGQNVDKVNTKVDLRFHVGSAEWISQDIRQRILDRVRLIY
jgi:hypothetical protein